MKVDTSLTGSNPRYVVFTEHFKVAFRHIFAHHNEQRVTASLAGRHLESSVRINHDGIFLAFRFLMYGLAAKYGIGVGRHLFLYGGTFQCRRHSAGQLGAGAEAIQCGVIFLTADLCHHRAVDASVHRHHHVTDDIRWFP